MFRGREAQTILNERVVNGRLAYTVPRGDGSDIYVSIVVRSKHLGLSMSFSRADTQEARDEASSAMSVYTPLAVRVFGAPGIFLSTKLALLQSLIKFRLLLNAQLVHPSW